MSIKMELSVINVACNYRHKYKIFLSVYTLHEEAVLSRNYVAS